MRAQAGPRLPQRGRGSYLPPSVTYSVRQRTWILTDAWWCRADDRVFRIPAGFCFDLSSIPRPLWWLLAPNELGIAPPLVHDFLYRCQGRVSDPAFTRRRVDELFRLLADEEGAWWWRRWAAWTAVRAFGYFAWKSHRQRLDPLQCADH